MNIKNPEPTPLLSKAGAFAPTSSPLRTITSSETRTFDSINTEKREALALRIKKLREVCGCAAGAIAIAVVMFTWPFCYPWIMKTYDLALVWAIAAIVPAAIAASILAKVFHIAIARWQARKLERILARMGTLL